MTGRKKEKGADWQIGNLLGQHPSITKVSKFKKFNISWKNEISS